MFLVKQKEHVETLKNAFSRLGFRAKSRCSARSVRKFEVVQFVKPKATPKEPGLCTLLEHNFVGI